MGSVSECTTSIVVCLYVGCMGVSVCMRVGMCDHDCVCLFLCQVGSWVASSPGSVPPRHTTCRWLVFQPAGVFVVLGVWGWVLWRVPAHSRRLLAMAQALWLCRTSAWGVMCPRVLGLWVHDWICSGVDGWGLWARCCRSLRLLHCGC
ncbi:hypothetical protein AMECASPLE_020763 [Ameca splendens]|uniref:Uncharacterized protein n=1 Tax=Ameca splendens TaxID=208324 RepID=A0ABV0YQ96_9TELE